MLINMNDFDVIIIGAGPAGLFAAAKCSAEGLKTCIMESNRSAGKKLLITGQGKCNITNNMTLSDFFKHYGSKGRFIRKCLYSFSNTDLINFFNHTGLLLKPRDDGKVFPVSEKASDVKAHLLKLCSNAGVELKYNSSIKRINLEDGYFNLFIDSENDQVNLQPPARTSKLIIAAGGYTLPSTGSNGSGYSLARMLGHNIIEPRPSLTGVVAESGDFTDFAVCSGVAVECGVSLFRNNSKINSYSGRLLFTHKGLSGPVIIDNSRDFFPGDELKINLLTDDDYESLSRDFINFCAENGKSGIKKFFTGKKIPERIISAVFSKSGAQTLISDKAAVVSVSDRKKLISAFTALNFRIKALEGRSKAMCTAGGVDTSEINSATMESRIVSGLYFAGEIIDIDGDSGGFNLQFAFSSARAAAGSISDQKKVDINT